MDVRNFRWVYITCKDKAEALKISREAVILKLAACANIIPGMTSVYEWKGEIVEDNECVLIFKTTDLLYPELERMVKKYHSYEIPCILGFQAVSGNEAYFQWIFNTTHTK